MIKTGKCIKKKKKAKKKAKSKKKSKKMKKKDKNLWQNSKKEIYILYISLCCMFLFN